MGVMSLGAVITRRMELLCLKTTNKRKSPVVTGIVPARTRMNVTRRIEIDCLQISAVGKW